jgi:hypothetical protein
MNDAKATVVSLEDVTAAATAGVLRALAARESVRDADAELPDFPWQILIGVIFSPGKPILSADGSADRPAQ